jgi:hypothetical protein
VRQRSVLPEGRGSDRVIAGFAGTDADRLFNRIENASTE